MVQRGRTPLHIQLADDVCKPMVREAHIEQRVPLCPSLYLAGRALFRCS